MHSAVCQVCAGAGWRWTMRVGVVTRRNPSRQVSVKVTQHCPGCPGDGNTTVPGRVLGARRLPAL